MCIIIYIRPKFQRISQQHMAQQMRQIPLTVEPTNPKPRDEP